MTTHLVFKLHISTPLPNGIRCFSTAVWEHPSCSAKHCIVNRGSSSESDWINVVPYEWRIPPRQSCCKYSSFLASLCGQDRVHEVKTLQSLYKIHFQCIINIHIDSFIIVRKIFTLLMYTLLMENSSHTTTFAMSFSLGRIILLIYFQHIGRDKFMIGRLLFVGKILPTRHCASAECCSAQASSRKVFKCVVA